MFANLVKGSAPADAVEGVAEINFEKELPSGKTFLTTPPFHNDNLGRVINFLMGVDLGQVLGWGYISTLPFQVGDLYFSLLVLSTRGTKHTSGKHRFRRPEK